MSEEHKSPSKAQLQKIVRDKISMDVHCMDANGTRYVGVLKWFDEDAFCLIDQDGDSVTISRRHILSYRQSR